MDHNAISCELISAFCIICIFSHIYQSFHSYVLGKKSNKELTIERVGFTGTAVVVDQDVEDLSALIEFYPLIVNLVL